MAKEVQNMDVSGVSLCGVDLVKPGDMRLVKTYTYTRT